MSAPPETIPSRPRAAPHATAEGSRASAAQGLNAAQREAVLAAAGPLLVLAGAGTGKTRVVIARIAHLVSRGARASRILAVTFTNKAAREMLARSKKLTRRNSATASRRSGGDASEPETPEISTIHSLCSRILRRHAPRLGYPERFAIIDRGEQEGLARRVLKELKVAEAALKPADLLDRISRWKTAGVRPAGAIEQAEADIWHLAASGYRRYQESLKRTGAMDFDDLLMLADELFVGHEDVRRQEAGRFDHLLVDEYQDTSRIQDRILTALARDHGSICVVGDDDQSIYGWRGAEVSHILEFTRRWPEARMVRLEENYRSTPEIIEAANQLIAHNGRRLGKKLVSTSCEGPPIVIMQASDEADEAKRVVGEVADRLRLQEMTPAESAILVRTGEQTRLFEQELRRRGVPYELVGSRSYFDRREVKDVMAFLRMLVDPDDDMAFTRIANLPPRGLSARVIDEARAAAATIGGSLWRELTAARDRGSLPPAASAGIDELARAIAAARAAGTAAAGSPRPSDALVVLLKAVGYQAHLEKEYDDPSDREARVACDEEFVNSLADHARSARKGEDFERLATRFLDELVLEVREAEKFRSEAPKGEALKLMTLHAAKGLEFDAVWMVGMEEGYLPHHRSLGEDGANLDEERRLCYVGVTRAKKRLTLSLCLARMKWGKLRPSRPSRFLYELTGQPERFSEEPTRDKPAGKAPPHRRGSKRARKR
jgi:DNA helicase-2/ATP-dependent DNA helicase PcrA